ncbi:MAG TPA: VOC family protein [Ohtaekwangia sp.]|uniref:VOC family protein n=1 Tax=Ohtaekwangia sp. TaxID=2066019 RepID=UPI002F93B923
MKAVKFMHAGVHLSVKNLQETLRYYRDTLGFYDAWTHGDKDGGLRRDDMRILFGENRAHTEAINTPAHRLNILWFVSNIDAIYQEFKGRNIAIASELKEYPTAFVNLPSSTSTAIIFV